MFWHIDYTQSPVILVSFFDGDINDNSFNEYCIDFKKIFTHAKDNNIKLKIIMNMNFNKIIPLKYIYKNMKFMKEIRQLGVEHFTKIYFILKNNISRILLKTIFTLLKPATPYEIHSSINDINIF